VGGRSGRRLDPVAAQALADERKPFLRRADVVRSRLRGCRCRRGGRSSSSERVEARRACRRADGHEWLAERWRTRSAGAVGAPDAPAAACRRLRRPRCRAEDSKDGVAHAPLSSHRDAEATTACCRERPVAPGGERRGPRRAARASDHSCASAASPPITRIIIKTMCPAVPLPRRERQRRRLSDETRSRKRN
jgi:hypothetical protein